MPMPTFLYHYLSDRELIQTLETNELQFDDIAFRGDVFEFRNFMTTLRGMLDDRRDELTSREVHDIDYMLDIVDHRLNRSPIYKVSMSDHADSLAYWRNYEDWAGFNIGFETSTLMSVLDTNTADYPIHLKQVQYGESAIRDRATEIMDDLVAIARAGQMDDNLELMNEEISLAAATYKADAYRDEREWCLLSLGGFDHIEFKIHLKSGGTSLIPYLKCPVIDTSSGNSTIAVITVGPGRDFELEQQALLNYKGSHRIFTYDVESSAISAP